VWIIPHNWRNIKKQYKMDFIPHIPVSKSHIEVPKIQTGTFEIVFQKRSGHFKNHDPLKMFAFDCYVSSIGKAKFPIYFTAIDDNSGLSLYDKMCESPINTTGYMCIANTFESNPSSWNIYNVDL
tara:strand:+ start:4067 stop:4441 length:375 start_codon:yes stop_codon:yes gene_type:complete